MCRFSLACMILLLLALGAWGQAPEMKVWVVTIGVGKYSRNFAALATAPRCARDVGQAVYDLQPDCTEVRAFTSDAQDENKRPNRANLADALNSLSRQMKPADRVIVYFCGHGLEFNGKSYLLLMDIADEKSLEGLENGGVSVEWLRDKLNAMPCRERLLWLDACRVDTLAVTGDATSAARQPQTATLKANAHLDGEAAATLTGCSAGEYVYYSKDGPSFFSIALREGLSGKASDERGQITMSSLARFVCERVPALLRVEYPKFKQTPESDPQQLPTSMLVLRPAPGYIACPSFPGEFGKTFAKTVYTRLAESREVNLVERERLDLALKELRLQDSGLTRTDDAQTLGKFLNAAYVLVGEVDTTPGGRLQISVRLVSVADGRQMPGVAGECTVNPNDDTWKPALQALTEELLVKMRMSNLTCKWIGGEARIDAGFCTIEVKSDPPGAAITVNGKPLGVTPVILTLNDIGETPVAVKVEVALKDYHSATDTKILTLGEQHTFSFTLKKGNALRINYKDGAEMVYVPAGEFLMGSSDADKLARSVEKPQRSVFLDGYWIYKTEVTVAQYRKFCLATGRAMPKEPTWKWQDTHPIVNVSWNDASAYTKWAGVQLPSEAQWEKAAHGTDGRIYPWGNDWDAAKCVIVEISTKPVGTIPAGASPFGCLDMAGNVSEWCADWYGSDYYRIAPARNPAGPITGKNRVLRGGSWNNFIDYDINNTRSTDRGEFNPVYWNDISGFRCVSLSPGP